MISFSFVDRDDSAPWGLIPLGAEDGWIVGIRPGSSPVPGAYERAPDAELLAVSLKIDGEIAGPCKLTLNDGFGPLPCGWHGSVSLGPIEGLTTRTAETIDRNIGAAICKAGLTRVFIDADLFPATAAAMAAGIALRATPHLDLRSDEEINKVEDFAETSPSPTEIIILTTNADKAKATWVETVRPGVQGTLWARQLIAFPGNALKPNNFQHQAETLTALGATVTTLNATELRQKKLNLLHAVGKGSDQSARLIIIEWPGAEDTAPIVLVGKGITFDTGGISIKPASGMEDMKSDMGGAAAVLGAMHAIATRKSSAHVIGLLAVAENAVSSTATRPGDVVKACNGTAVEIVDTDAEGRLVLADALAYAKATYAPAMMIDLATLTGAVVRTLGREYAGLFTPDDAVATALTTAADISGEAIWRLPLPSDKDKSLESEIADLKNCAWGVVPDAIHAAGFLSHFAKDVPWAHLDIAGVADAAEDTDINRKGPRGFGVRLLDTFICTVENKRP